MARFYPRVLRRIVSYLDEVGEASTPQIYDRLVSDTKQAPTMQQLSMMLAKHRLFVKVGHTRTRALLGGRYEVCVWALSSAYEHD